MTTTSLHSTGISGKAKASLNKVLLTGGILSSLFYVAINVFVPMQYEGYNSASQTVSELSAIGAPTRSLWILLVSVYSVLTLAFGWGVVRVSAQNRYLHWVGLLIIAYTIFGLFWPPMHQRETLAAGGGSLTDTLHIAWTIVTIPLWLLIMGLAARLFGRWFLIYTVATVVIQLSFGVLTGLQSADMEANLPTPWMGIWERISIAAYMVWVIVFAIILLQQEKAPES
jgi:Protein of unknown function (DUF998)